MIKTIIWRDKYTVDQSPKQEFLLLRALEVARREKMKKQRKKLTQIRSGLSKYLLNVRVMKFVN